MIKGVEIKKNYLKDKEIIFELENRSKFKTLLLLEKKNRKKGVTNCFRNEKSRMFFYTIRKKLTVFSIFYFPLSHSHALLN
jgi:hypothetical protein